MTFRFNELLPKEEVRHLFKPVEERARLQRSLGLSPSVILERLLTEYDLLDPQGACSRFASPSLSYVQRSPWLSQHLRRPVFRLKHLLGEKIEERLDVLRGSLQRLKRDASGGLLIARVPSESVALIQGMSRFGFGWVGVEVTGVIKLDTPPARASEVEAQGVSLDPLTSHDMDQAREIAGKSHIYNHFAQDPLLPSLEVHHLFKEQVSLHLTRKRSQGFGAFSPVGVEVTPDSRELLGFLIANKVEGFLPMGGPLVANLDFVCVNPDQRLRGLGHALNLSALSWLYQEGVRRVSVRTMMNNFAAQRILSRIDWRPQLAECVLHLHI